MPPDSPTKVLRCATCHAALPLGDQRCWLCGGAVVARAERTGLVSSPAAVRHSRHAPATSFSLATLMLFVTLAAVVCGVISIAPGVGIALGLVLLPVLAQTAILAHREEELGHSLLPGEKVMLFFGSLGIVALAGMAAAIAFGVTCFVSGWGGVIVLGSIGSGEAGIGWGIACGFILGTIAGVYVGYRALRALLRQKGIIELSLRSKVILAVAVFLAVVGALIVFSTIDF